MTQSYYENIKNDRKSLTKLSLWAIAAIGSLGMWDLPLLHAAPASENVTYNTQEYRVHGSRASLEKSQSKKYHKYFVHNSASSTKNFAHMKQRTAQMYSSRKQILPNYIAHVGSSLNRSARMDSIDATPQLSQYASRARMFDSQYFRYALHFAGKKDYHSIAVHAALSRVGAPYLWGSTGPNAFDCSGLIVWSYKHSGITLPRSTWGQMSVGKPVHSIAELQPADLVITDGGGHVGMYIGHGMMVHAPDMGDRVKIVPVKSLSIYSMRHI